MSSRQLRKIQKQREEEEAAAKLQEQEQDPDGDDEEGYQQPPSKASLFSSLAAFEDEGAEEDEELEDGVSKTEHIESESDEESQPALVKKPKKSKKKKKKKANEAQGESNAQTHKTDQGLDEIDAALKELNIKAGKAALDITDVSNVLDPEYRRVCALLGINSQHLKVANEMRNLFGKTAVENHDDAGGAVPRGGRRRRAAQQQMDLESALKGHHQPGKGLPELTLRRNIFIQGKEEWPRGTTAGLTMEVIDDQQAVDGTIEFRFVHTQAYELVQQQFRMMVEMGDPQNLIGLLQRNPYNISLLLQVSKVAKDQSDHALSSDLVERALFTFARASTSLFATKLSEGKARLDFARPENRELWLAGYQYIKSLVMKGTYRTALEWAKLLLSLDPEQDPYCMMLMIHHLALRAHESDYILSLAETFLMKTSDMGMWKPSVSHTVPSLALAAMQLGDGVKSRQLLKDSIQQLPWLYCKLFQELNLDNPPPSIWGVVPRTDAENLFTEIYVRQTKDLWNTPEATGLLMEVAFAAEKLGEEELMRTSNLDVTLDVARFCYLDNTPALMALVPSKLLHRIPNSDSDPLPPDINVFSWPGQRAPFADNENGRDLRNELGDHFDPIAAIRRLLPGFVGDGGPADEQALADAGLRDMLEPELAHERADIDGTEDDTDSDAGEEVEVPGEASGMRWFYERIFGRRSQPQPETEQVHEDPEPGSQDGPPSDQ